MIFIVIGIMLFVAVGAIMTQQTRHSDAPEDVPDPTFVTVLEQVMPPIDARTLQGSSQSSDGAPVSSDASAASPGQAPPPSPEEPIPLRPGMAAAPISAPNALSGATYSSSAPTNLGDSPYAFGSSQEETKKPDAKLLRWSGKTGSIMVGDFAMHGPVAYWSEGRSSVAEPSCVDITMPVEFQLEAETAPDAPEDAVSYADMTPAQRGVYLSWLAGGRIQSPPHPCYPLLWLFGLERRVLSDRLDTALCIGEAFRLLSILRADSLRQTFIKFITWMAAKTWLPEEQLVMFSHALPVIPKEILCMLLRPYVDAKLPLPSSVAFIVMRSNPFVGEEERKASHIGYSQTLVDRFSSEYKSKCSGGIVLTKPKSSVYVAYVPSNPSLVGDKNAVGGVLELPDFFKDATDFTPLFSVWEAFKTELTENPVSEPKRQTAAQTIKMRPDWEAFIRRLYGLPTEENAEPLSPDQIKPVLTDLGALGDLMSIEHTVRNYEEKSEPEVQREKRIIAADRKKIVETARVEGFLVLPDLGIAGKEYRWDDLVVLTPFPLGERLSQDYNASALLLEYACSLTGMFDEETMAKMRLSFNDYFSLSSDDQTRLGTLSTVLYAASSLASVENVENIGECLQFWLNRDERAVIRDFMVSFLTENAPPPEPVPPELLTENALPATEAEWTRKIYSSLDVTENSPAQLVFSGEHPRLELGELISNILSPLFKD
ncbi:hypothetical protein FACS1894204_01730 [Synergistales bacterium]|nr:hypothetical protein FACS1894204_01730 [Synergistales bacterium]